MLGDFFLASPTELREACRGWKEPLLTPVKRQGVNPFTKKPFEILTTAPDPSEPFAHDATRNADLSRLHRVDSKGLSSVELESLMRVALGSAADVRAVHDCALWPPPGTEESILRVPPALIAWLAALDEKDFSEWAKRWSAAHGRDLSLYFAPIAMLARKVTADEARQMYMWLAP